MWSAIIIALGFFAGLTTGYKYVHKKTVPLIKFISEKDKEKALQERGIRLDESTKCSVCGDIIKIENLGALIAGETGNLFLCSKTQCMTVSDLWKLTSKSKK